MIKIKEPKIKFDYHDFWMGFYWKHSIIGDIYDVEECMNIPVRCVKIYICIIPMFPISFKVYSGKKLVWEEEYEED